jgi:hypothetical protein
MLKDFFRLNGKPGKIEAQEEFFSHLEKSDHLKDVIYTPEELYIDRPKNKLRNKLFQNVSFSKTIIKNINFINCSFEDCLFIGTEFLSCEFHGCSFICCNPYQSVFKQTYLNPTHFAKILNPREHSNIGIILFQRLMANFIELKQLQFSKLSEYYFRKWKRYQLCYELRNKKITIAQFLKKWVPDKLYDLFAGYGLRTAPFIAWTLIIFLFIIFTNHILWDNFGMKSELAGISQPNLITTFYYTVITLSTLGYGDITPSTSLGMALAGIESILGIIWLAILASIIIKKIAR